jgi:hypothetical protein
VETRQARGGVAKNPWPCPPGMVHVGFRAARRGSSVGRWRTTVGEVREGGERERERKMGTNTKSDGAQKDSKHRNARGVGGEVSRRRLTVALPSMHNMSSTLSVSHEALNWAREEGSSRGSSPTRALEESC